jgi:hypothetical protein
MPKAAPHDRLLAVGGSLDQRIAFRRLALSLALGLPPVTRSSALAPREFAAAYIADLIVHLHVMGHSNYGAPGVHCELRLAGASGGLQARGPAEGMRRRAGHRSSPRHRAAAEHDDRLPRQPGPLRQHCQQLVIGIVS